MTNGLPFEFETSIERRLKSREHRGFRKLGGAGRFLRNGPSDRQRVRIGLTLSAFRLAGRLSTSWRTRGCGVNRRIRSVDALNALLLRSSG